MIQGPADLIMDVAGGEKKKKQERTTTTTTKHVKSPDQTIIAEEVFGERRLCIPCIVGERASRGQSHE